MWDTGSNFGTVSDSGNFKGGGGGGGVRGHKPPVNL